MSAHPGDWREGLRRYLAVGIWRREPAPSAWRRAGRRALQLAVIVGQGTARDQTLLRASALTYFTMLSLIPLLALALSLVEAFGVSADLAHLVVDRIAAGSPEARDRILELVERVDFGRLGALGAGALGVTTVLAIGAVERAFNQIWGVERERSLPRRFADYLAVLVVAPLLLGIAVSVGASLRSHTAVQAVLQRSELSGLARSALGAVPGVLQWLGFAFLYGWMPNTKVRWVPALVGGALAALLFSLAQWLYLGFHIGVARSNALFGSFAALPLLLVWIYVSWVVVLVGCELAFAWQNLASFRQARAGEEPGPAAREAIALAVAARMARGFRAGTGGFTAEGLAEELDVPVRTVRAVLARLEERDLVAPRGGGDADAYQLARAAEGIPVADVLAAMRGPRHFGGHDPAESGVGELLASLDRSTQEVLQGRSLAELAAERAAPRPVDPRDGDA